jgi:cyclophilin family peptidyl-prolyl cis-trans isomerase
MNRLLAIPVVFAVCLLVAGCGPSTEEALVKDINDLNATTAESIAKAEDAAGIQAAMKKHGEREAAIVARVNALAPDRRKEFVRTLEDKTAESTARLDKAVEAAQEKLTQGPNPQVLLETSKGPIKIELYDKLAPVTVKNFLGYVDEKFYDGTIFHRVIPDFMIQGGGFEPGMKEKKTHAPIINESFNGLSNRRGTLAMARTSDPNSASAQFFINVKDNPFLDKAKARDGFGYAVFGKVVDGMDVVDKIRNVPTATRDGHENVPKEDVLIQSARRVEGKK